MEIHGDSGNSPACVAWCRKQGGSNSTCIQPAVWTANSTPQIIANNISQGLPKRLSGKKICLPMQETLVRSLGWEDLLKEEMKPHFSILAWESDGQRSLEGYSPWDCNKSDMTEHLSTIPISHGTLVLNLD